MSTTTAATAPSPPVPPAQLPAYRRTGWATAQISSATSSARHPSSSHFCTRRRAAVRWTLSLTNRNVLNSTTGVFFRYSRWSRIGTAASGRANRAAAKEKE